MAILENYVPDEVEAQAGFEPLPQGEYAAVATESELKDTKAGTGKYIQFTFEIFEGKFKGRKTWARYNLVNPNPEAANIGKSQLKQFAEAAGKAKAVDSEELHNIPVTLYVTLKDGNNDVKSVKPYGKQTEAAQKSSGDKPAWMNK